MNDMRKLLSAAIPPPEDEPQQRDVIGAAMEWGERRRRLDWVLTAAAALAVVAVGAGAAVLGTGSGSGTSAASGGIDPQTGVTTLLDPGIINGRPFPSFTPTCMPPGNLPPSDKVKYCQLWQEETNWMNEFARGSVPYIQAALPQGFTVKASNSYVVQLTGANGKTNMLFPAASSASILNGHTPSCPQGGGDCQQTSIGGGHGVVNKFPSAGESAVWAPDGLKDPVILLGVNTVGLPAIGDLPAPTGEALLSAADIERIISNPDYVSYAKQSWQHEQEVHQQLMKLEASRSPTSSSQSWTGQPSGTPTSSPSATGSGMPTGTPPTGSDS